MFSFLQRIIILFSIFCLLPGCGSGGGGSIDRDGNPSRVSLSTSPSRIDSGDRTTITMVISDIAVDEVEGLLIKVLHPSGLQYVSNSAMLERDDIEDVPLHPKTEAADESGYVLIFLTTANFPEGSDIGVITLKMTGIAEVRGGEFSVDVDTADTNTFRTFDAANPQFTSLESVSIRVDQDL